MYSYFCAATIAKELYRCRTSSGGEFVIGLCVGNQDIYIRSAVVGFSPTVKSNNTDQRCPPLSATCTRSATNHSAIMNCQRERGCRIPQGVFYYPPDDKLCEVQQNGNFIKIKYDCVNPGKWISCWLM